MALGAGTTQLVFLIVLLCSAASGAVAGGQRLPNIVFILADDMGYGDPRCYNPQSKIPTPHIDRLAREGMRFTDAHSPGAWCVPTRYALMTGRYPFRTSFTEWRQRGLIDKGRLTIASVLKRRGYSTAMVGKWHLGLDGGPDYDYSKRLSGGPVDHGFDYYFGIPHSLDIAPYYYIRNDRAVAPPAETIAASHSPGWRSTQGKFWRTGRVAPGFQHADVLPRFTEESVHYIADHAQDSRQRPFFLYFALPAPHTPWLPTRQYEGKSEAGLYGDFVAMVDDAVGRILNALDEHQLAENTLVFFTSDNGPVWFPEDVKKYGHRSAHTLRGKKGHAWEGGHRMPFLARWPGRIEAGGVCDEMFCQVDMLATFAELVDHDLPQDAGEDSFSFLPVLLGRNRNKPLREIMVIHANTLVIRRGGWKLIAPPRSRGEGPASEGPEGELYNLDEDLSETNNLWAEEPDIVRQLNASLQQLKNQGHSR